jgi:hypothetical protein
LALFGRIIFPLGFYQIDPRLSVFENENDLPANLVVLPSEIAVAVESTHSLFRASVLLPTDTELAGDPGSQAIAILHFPSFASPLDIMLVMVWKELLSDIENKPFQSVHAIGAPLL